MLFLEDSSLLGLSWEILQRLAQTLPSILSALLVLIVGLLLSKGVSKMLRKVLAATGIDRLATRLNDIEIVQRSHISIIPSTLIAKTVYYLLLLISIIVATDILGMPVVSQLVRDLINYIPSLIAASIVLFAGVLLADTIKGIVLTTCKSLGIPSAGMIANFVFYFIFLTVAISALSQAKIDTDFIKSNLTIILGGIVFAFALGYGFASKDLMSSFLTSFYTKDRINPGDIVTIDNIRGEIIEIDTTSLVIQTETKRVIIPMNKLSSEKIEIHHANDDDHPLLDSRMKKLE